MSRELKPCPFCGGEAQLITNCLKTTRYSYVRCLKCDVQIAESNFNPEFLEISPDEATERSKNAAAADWNRRALGWIDVRDRMPEETPANNIMLHDGTPCMASKIVLVAVTDSKGNRYVSTDATVDGEWDEYDGVTHWMPLPPLP